MNTNILNTDVQDFILKNISTDILSILLKRQLFETVSNQELVEQIEAKIRCKKKLPLWYETPRIFYPNKLNIEQTSSEKTARYKANLFSGKSFIDLTGGFGVDDYYFSKSFDQVIHCELNAELSKIAAYNFSMLNANNISCINEDGIQYLANTKSKFDCIYVDPSRRNEIKGKVFKLEDCLPNIPEHIDLLMEKGKVLIIKTSPMLDISIGLKELKHCKQLHIIALNNEVKELLWILSKSASTLEKITTVNIGVNEEKFEFSPEDIEKSRTNYSPPLKYLYEPNSAIMKSGAFSLISETYNTPKLHEHSHLYTSNVLVDEFPGRKFTIDKTTPYNPKSLRKSMGNSKANIATRNFPENPDQIKKRLKLKDGGTLYLFFTTDIENNKIVLWCTKTG
ncbi:16S rRNA G966 N2-methylase RsmD [Zhouia amylolytica]|uniref:16S rRNA G966 N2-methylase RsmD n=1 Tax=Zhouia amylolytica TaxID=376730 RepID=A0A1I6VJG5_9FLAO|nr:class I SAM-dependent methyltransferase [Zhouia amylolytica]MCQ0112312.1 class I SAM-dependent methyltransferase [Zhouia amylolytica]SFT13830.1 16S rRNA G966 N2-methylase RsmD [Zhouia amylolytica]